MSKKSVLWLVSVFSFLSSFEALAKSEKKVFKNGPCAYHTFRSLEEFNVNYQWNQRSQTARSIQFSEVFTNDFVSAPVYGIVVSFSPINVRGCHSSIPNRAYEWVYELKDDALFLASQNQVKEIVDESDSVESEIEVEPIDPSLTLDVLGTPTYQKVVGHIAFAESYPVIVKAGTELRFCGAIAFHNNEEKKELSYVFKLWEPKDGKCFQMDHENIEIKAQNSCLKFNKLPTLSRSEISGVQAPPITNPLSESTEQSYAGRPGFRTIPLGEVDDFGQVYRNCDGNQLLEEAITYDARLTSIEIEPLAYPEINDQNYSTMIMNFDHGLTYYVIDNK